MFCERCGNSIRDKASFCNKCGNSLKPIIAENVPITPTSMDGTYLLKPNEKFGGFWVRVGSYIIDTALSTLVGIIIVKNLELGIDYFILISYIVFLLYVMLATTFYSTTLGKKAFGLKVVNKKDGNKIGFWKSFGRCLSYFLSCFLLYAGFWTAGLDSKKQGWHDKIVSTIVIRDKKVGFGLGIFLTIVSLVVLFMLFTYSEKDVSNNNEQSQETVANVSKEETQEIDPVTKADYQEGYKAGYVDGRASKGQLGDNYSEPATEERKDAYFLGYLDGFLKGCKEGDFDCSEVENAISSTEQENSVNLIPSAVN